MAPLLDYKDDLSTQGDDDHNQIEQNDNCEWNRFDSSGSNSSPTSLMQEYHSEEQNEESSLDAANISEIKRKAILLLSHVHKTERGPARIKAMSLLTTLYKAETEEDIRAMEKEIRDLLKLKKEEEDRTRKQAEIEAAARQPERFTRFKATWSKLFQPKDHCSIPPPRHSTPTTLPTRSPALLSQRYQQPQRKAEPPTWRFFWQRDATTMDETISLPVGPSTQRPNSFVGEHHGLVGVEDPNNFGTPKLSLTRKQPSRTGLDVHSM